MSSDPSTPLERGRMFRVADSIWCFEHGEVHAKTLDPYDEGRPTCYDGLFGTRSPSMVHRPIFVGYRKGDYPPEDGEV